jgi:hypothetical protein
MKPEDKAKVQQAIKAFWVATTPLAKDRQEVLAAITALRQLLEIEPVQEPVAPGVNPLWLASHPDQLTTPPAAAAAPVNERMEVLDRIKEALPEFRQQDDYLLAHGALLLSEQSHEIIHVDTALRIAGLYTTPPTHPPVQQEGD